jgi:hypothetical protein
MLYQQNKKVHYKNLGLVSYRQAWLFQEELFDGIIAQKTVNRVATEKEQTITNNYLLLCQHPPVYTLGKSGKPENLLLSESELEDKEIEYYKINRGGDITSIVLDTYMAAFSDLESREPGVWSLSQGEKSLFVNNSAANLIDESGISLELIRAIPVPAADVPLNEILEFKEKRKDELMMFRAHIDQLVLEIQNSPARTDAFNRIAREVDAACADLLKVGHEWQWPVHFSNFKATFNLDLDKFLNAAKAGWELLEPYGPLAQTSAAAVSGLVSTITVKPDISLRSIKKPSSPYRYTLLAHKELV